MEQSLRNKRGGGNKEETEDAIATFRLDISILSTKINNMVNTKEAIEKFYQVELKKCLDKLQDKTDKIDELASINKKMQNDYFGKKESIFHLWMLEFEEFKDKLLSLNELKNLVGKFDSRKEELKVLQHNVYEEEMHYLRQECNAKENNEDKFKKIFLDQINALKKINENFKDSLNEKLKNLDVITKQRVMDIEALMNDKQKVVEIEKKKLENAKKAEKLDTDEKGLISNINTRQMKIKEDEINELKNEIEKVSAEVSFHKEMFKSNFEEVKRSVHLQIAQIKERETFTNKQFNNLEEKFENMKMEKDRLLKLQKEELDNLNKNNKILAKLKIEKN